MGILDHRHYLIIGNGRAARHCCHYFTLLNVSFAVWCRQEPVAKLIACLPHASHILLLINDQAIDAVIEQCLKDTTALKIHFSGSLVSKYAYGAHPLTSFAESLYPLATYQAIPFVLDDDAPDFEILFPDLPNPYWCLPKSLKAKYHALCVLSGNFSCMLWQKLFHTLEAEFNLPASIAHPYLMQQTTNLMQDFTTALTGPLVRNDVDTITKNLTALAADPFQEIYRSFIRCYQKQQEE